MIDPSATARILREGLSLIRHPDGFLKEKFANEHGQVCSLGAIRYAQGAGDRHPAHALVAEVIREQYPDRRHCARASGDRDDIVMFNNHPATTQAEVEAVFEKAIARAEEAIH